MTLMVWPSCLVSWGLPKRRRITDIVRDVALLPSPLHLWDSGWVSVPLVAIIAEDVCLWLYSVDILIKFVTFLGSLHFPAAVTIPAITITCSPFFHAVTVGVAAPNYFQLQLQPRSLHGIIFQFRLQPRSRYGKTVSNDNIR